MKEILNRATVERIIKIVPLLAPQLTDVDDVEWQSLEIFALAAWSGLGEPGDRMVRWLCDALGAQNSLREVMVGTTASELARQVESSSSGSAEPPDDICVQDIAEALERWRPRLSEQESIAHLERAQRIGAKVITEKSSLWPPGLRDLGHHRPAILWVRGKLDALSALDRSVSVVGARASTGYGEHVTMELVSDLASAGFAVVSGAAYGIDGMAHRAALTAGATTIAVLAGGIDRLYPSGHDALLNRIIETGAVLTEMPCGFAPTKWRFLQRNRIIAAISQVTVVVEAGWRSGSLNTAHHALELDRPLGVIPGPVTSGSSAGCHRLLRETPAVCVTTAREVLELSEAEQKLHLDDSENLSPRALRVLDALSVRAPRDVDDIARASGLTSDEVKSELGLQELTGRAHRNDRGWLKREETMKTFF